MNNHDQTAILNELKCDHPAYAKVMALAIEIDQVFLEETTFAHARLVFILKMLAIQPLFGSDTGYQKMLDMAMLFTTKQDASEKTTS